MSLMGLGGSKTKNKRPRKTIKQKVDSAADKMLFKLIKDDPEILRAYINKKYGLEIPCEADRRMKKLIDQTRLAVSEKVAADLHYDPEVVEIMRDKLIADLLGMPGSGPVVRKGNNYTQRPNPESPLKRVKRTISEFNEIKAALGSDDIGWSQVLGNPEVIKLLGEVFRSVAPKFGLGRASENPQTYLVEIDGEMKKMDQAAIIQTLLDRSGANSGQGSLQGITSQKQNIVVIGKFVGNTPAGMLPPNHADSNHTGNPPAQS